MKFLFHFILSIFLFACLFPPARIHAQGTAVEETMEGQITQILEEKQIQPMGMETSQLYQKLEILVSTGKLKDQEITLENGNLPQANVNKYEVGEKVIVSVRKEFDGQEIFFISDSLRRDPLLFLAVLFIGLTIFIAKRKGIYSLFALGVSFCVIFYFILPKIVSGANPVGIAILGSLIIIPISFGLSHGWNKKTLVAIIGTMITLIITGILASIFVEATKLTGFASEEASFLQVALGGTVNMKGILLAGIIIGALGVLDDITISQSAIVFELKKANPKLNFSELYNHAMSVGQDHISSIVNTLVLVYTGAALPLLLLFSDTQKSFEEVLNSEMVADEIVRTLVGSIGLILAVPITTFIASFAAFRESRTGVEKIE